MYVAFRKFFDIFTIIINTTAILKFSTTSSSFIFAQAIISEASLSFLGAGVPATEPSWGNILQSSKSVVSKAPWTAIFPGLAVVLCVLSLNLLGNGLRDYLDPRTAGRKKK